ncbi:2Fe-2S iron-sulfur cluster-binding protein [Celerinatantimonas sp. YJH-8]|uniref:2Fe-2S iron-sulfur cluster-binding protein n=1 Tax=Celerinatantimonas sp. YJH-8 TaxID=3228714 RepID=UPI0038C6AD12
MDNTSVSTVNTDSFIPVNTQTWTNGRHVVRCVKMIQETWNVKTFCFMADQPTMFFFKPGQFVTLELNIRGEILYRSYTISSSPSVPYSFSITVKRVAGGVVSNWIHDHIEEGAELAVHGPAGQFNSIDFASDKVLFLSGGVGITPVMSMARWNYDTNADADMVFVHSARTPQDLIYQHELEWMSSRITNFHLYLICEQIESGQVWSGFRGYLDAIKLKMMAPDFLEREIFCCGPAIYMNVVRKLLQDNGFDMSHYHEESFGASPEVADPELPEPVPVGDQIQVVFANADKTVDIAPGETIHAAAVKAGLTIPKACGMGLCGTCKVKRLDGEVEMSHNGGITDEDVEEGYILSCCSVPKGNVTIEF